MSGGTGAASFDNLWAISPLDGRYGGQLSGLGRFVSEGALIRYRAQVEVQWVLHLAVLPETQKYLELSPACAAVLRELATSKADDWQRLVKEIERTTNHDVKAVEYYLQERLKAAGATNKTLAFIHFACTSEDINNLAYALMLRDLREHRILPLLQEILQDLAAKAAEYAALPMLARTHGQTATPTTLGKELAVFGHRLQRQMIFLNALQIDGKINGAVGNYNAHVAAFPELDWPRVARSFVEERLGLSFNPLTTQIENHDSLVEFAGVLAHINTLLIGLSRDIWSYVSIGYFKQRVKAGEVGSSTMPHKVNPIDFENAEGNFGIANAIARHFADKLPISRWQRDLSDSTVLRAIGELVGHSELGWRSLLRGLGKIIAAPAAIERDLGEAWEVLAEPVQTVMRRHGVVDAYERLKAATRGKAVTRETLLAVIADCQELPAEVKKQLSAMTPTGYTGLAEKLARDFATSVTQ
ncbi:MAG: adenylosuccinate lyase [Deltaproteobacteria bacterium]|nr:adenylosuccinate lyase [Deltaproteobacteria bacterium]